MFCNACMATPLLAQKVILHEKNKIRYSLRVNQKLNTSVNVVLGSYLVLLESICEQ